jgi:hypothetical protein
MSLFFGYLGSVEPDNVGLKKRFTRFGEWSPDLLQSGGVLLLQATLSCRMGPSFVTPFYFRLVAEIYRIKHSQNRCLKKSVLDKYLSRCLHPSPSEPR